jgi:hypothetical protein
MLAIEINAILVLIEQALIFPSHFNSISLNIDEQIKGA